MTSMPTIQTRIPTARAERYLHQFCKHAAAMSSPRGHRMRMHGGSPVASGEVRLRVEESERLATVVFDPWGRCVLRADANTLEVRIDGADQQALQRIRDTVTRDLERFGSRDLTVRWDSIDDSTAAEAEQ